jgi:hypothetical protein
MTKSWEKKRQELEIELRRKLRAALNEESVAARKLGKPCTPYPPSAELLPPRTESRKWTKSLEF